MLRPSIDRIEELFFAAIDLPPAERAEFLDRHCPPALRAQVDALLSSDARAVNNPLWQGSALDAEARSVAVDETELRIGQRLGSYRIVRRIGAGGMGVVYEAVRDDHEFEKRVAIKLVQRAVASPEALDRLRTERQILANLEHAFIARLFDGGTSPEGLPYLVMELVEGRPVDQFVAGLDRDARLKLYRQICSAVSYAHRNLVVHRDLKPANILVAADGSPKLLDFGIAQLLDSGAAAPGMTPAYASPEQKQGLKGSVASDVYSLGVLLRELIPVEDADLLAIAAKAVRENPAERYESVDRLSDDVARFRDQRPVLARQQSFTYRATKFMRRRRVPIAIAAALLTIAAAGSLALARSTAAARRGRMEAEGLANTREFQPGGSLAYPAGMTTVRKSVDQRSVDSLERLLKESPDDAALQRELATAYQRLALVQGTVFSANIGDRGTARATMEKALYLRERLFDANRSSAADRAAFVETLGYLGRMAISDGEPDEAYRVHIRAWNESQSLIERGQLDEPFHIAARVEYLLGIDLGGTGYSPNLGDPAGALAHHSHSLQLLERWIETHPDSAGEIPIREELIAIDLARLERFPEAERHVGRAIALMPRQQPGMGTAGDSRTWCLVRSCSAWILTLEGKPSEAARLAAEAQDGAAKLVEADPANVRARLDLSIADGVAGRAAVLMGDSRKGTEFLNRAIDDEEKLFKNDPSWAELRGALARHYLWSAAAAVASKKWSAAERRYRDAAELTAQTLAAHSSDANARENLAAAYLGTARILAHAGHREEASRMSRKAAAEAQAILTLHPENPSVRSILDQK